jgi:16S rRNA (cytosine967-C5)-methyltransferase
MTAREAALLTLSACERQGAWSDGMLKKTLREGELETRDAALATRLCLGVLQNRMLLDFFLSHFSTMKLEKMEGKVRNNLRLAVYQMAFLSRIPHSAAVNEAVELTRKHCKNPRAPGMVNGILRNISRSIDHLPLVDGSEPLEYLSVRYSHPKWLVEAFVDRLGISEAEALLQMDNREAPVVAQVNTYKTDCQALSRRLAEEGVEAQPHPWLSNCLLLQGTGNLERLPSFLDGEYYIQDMAARLAVEVLAPKPGQHLLDACGAPGGKSFAAAIAMGNCGEVLTCDIHPHKKTLIEAGARRLGLDCIRASILDAKRHNPSLDGQFDAVIADVPCSGLGVIRKKPEIRYKNQAELAGLPAVQLAILENVSHYLKPGGVLLYSTCTLLEQENEAVVTQFLQGHPEFQLVPFSLPDPIGACRDGMITLWPHLHDTDGFFIAKLQKV